jgi:hypothetical protein
VRRLIATVVTAWKSGPFVRDTHNELLLLLQIFMG